MTQQNSLYVFTHIPKTAGAYLKVNIRSANPLGYTLDAIQQGLFMNVHTGKMDCYCDEAHFLSYFHSLTTEQKDKIQFISGHNAYYGIHKLLNKPAKYITIVREPVSRTISMYNFLLTCWDRDSSEKKPSTLQTIFLDRLNNILLVDGKVPGFEEWLHHKLLQSEKTPHLGTMCDFLQSLKFMDSKRDQSSLQEALKKFHFVGLTETFDTDSAYLYRLFNVKSCRGNENKSIQHVRQNKISVETLNKIREAHQDDMLLYECAQRENERFKSETKDFYIKVAETKRIRKFYFPLEWTQKKVKSMLKPLVKPIMDRLGLR